MFSCLPIALGERARKPYWTQENSRVVMISFMQPMSSNMVKKLMIV